MIFAAYSQGFFPMAPKGGSLDVDWVMPEIRGILPIKDIHIPRSLLKTLKKKSFDVSVDKAFEQVIHACAKTKTGREETWINTKIIDAYIETHRAGFAHSIEVWKEGFLIGGLYGLRIGGAFFGESMFSKRPNASKVALIHLAARLFKGGFTLLDAQFPNDHLEQFGCFEQKHNDYIEDLNEAMAIDANFYPPEFAAGEEIDEVLSSEALLDFFLQSRTQMS